MRLPDEPAFATHHFQFVGGGADVVDLAVVGMVFLERLSGAADLRPVDGPREDRGVMAAEPGVGLLAGHDQEITVGVAAAGVEVGLLLPEPGGAGVLGVTVPMEVRHHGDVDAEGAKGRDPRRLEVERAGVGDSLVEVGVEVADGDLVTRERLVAVVVGEGKHGFLSGGRRLGAEVVVDGHALPGP
ncbi:MAG: hypothetical protein DMG07_29340, partial [Acidobacteria bacterium]